MELREKELDSKPKKKREMPNAFVILLFMMFIAMLATWFVPAGQFEREEGPEGRMIVVPGSFQETESTPVGIFGMLEAIPNGLADAAMISMTILIIGGTWAVLNQSGAITSGVGSLAKKLGKSEMLIIPIMMIIFSTIAAFIGALELAIVYVPVMIVLARALRLDNMTAVAMSLVATGGAFSASLTNPFTVGLGQQIVGLPLYSGIGYRLIVLLVFVSIGIAYVMWYAIRVRKNPKNSLVYDENNDQNQESVEFLEPKKEHKLIWILLIAAFGTITYGVLKLGWYLYEIGAIFFALALLSAVIGRISLNSMTETFVKGAQGVLLAALVVGLARSILIIIENGQIIDTISLGLVNMIQGMPQFIMPVGFFISQAFLNFVVNSGSGQVLLTMPILSPVAELVGITQQTTVLATQLGDGITNLVFPVSGVLMGCLAFANVSFIKWLKFIMPLVIIWMLLGSVFLVIAQMIHWGPF
ncbi:MAG: YfcC family protein [Oceanobacillus sp.]|nr:YfcC family protein [Oceanobacillus sp.]PAE28391.1 hypothetical protein CHI07_13835 [Paenibacillus sp. 7884-2]